MSNNRIYGTQKALSLYAAANIIKKRKLYEKNRIVNNLIHLKWQRQGLAR